MSGAGYRIEINARALQALGAGGFDGPAATHLVEAVARIVADAIKQTLEEAPARTGRKYTIPGTRKKYTASAPGEVPAVREGRYRDGWKPTKGVVVGKRAVAFAQNAVTTEGGDAVGALLEDGTASMAPRPHIREGMHLARPRIEALLRGGPER